MGRRSCAIAAFLMLSLGMTASCEPIPVRHIQRPMHRFMTVRSEDGRTIASGEFTQVVQGDQVTMRLTFRFVDGSVDDEVTTFRQQGTLRLLSNHHIQQGPFFSRPIDLTVEATSGTVTSRTTDKKGKTHVESKHMDLPADLANGFVGSVLLNVPPNTRPFQVGLLAPVAGGRLIKLRISPGEEHAVQLAGQTFSATVFRIHPELGGFINVIARLIGLQPKDVMVWVLEGDDPAVALIVGQLGGYGPVVSCDLVGTSFGNE